MRDPPDRCRTADEGGLCDDGLSGSQGGCDVLDELEQLNPSAARSLAEGMEEALTLHRLGIPEELRVTLRTTNIIESSLSRVDDLAR